jgi:hypothetical protein
MEQTTVIDAIIGQENVFDIDTDYSLDSVGDEYTFAASHRKGDLPVIVKTKGSGIQIDNATEGKLTVNLDPADTANLSVEDYMGNTRKPFALVYEMTVDPGGGGKPQTVASGVLMLARAVS